MNSIIRSTYRPASSRIIYHLSDGMTTDPQIGQRFLGRGAPLSSFDNPVIDDLQRDVFWMTYMKDMPFRDFVPDGRELNRSLIDWLMSDPNWLQLSNYFSGRKLVSAAVAYEMTQRLLDMVDGAKAAMAAMYAAEDLEEQADRKERGEPDPKEENDSDDDGENELPWDTSQDDRQPWDDEDEDDEDDEDGGGSDGDDDDESGDDDDDESEEDGNEGGADIGETPDEMRERADQFRETSRNAQSRAEAAMNKSNATMFRSSIVSDGQQTGEMMSAFMQAWGIEDGEVITLPIGEINQLMQMVGNPAFAQLSYLMGRIYNVGMKVLTGRSSIDLVQDEPGYTDDLNDIDLIDLGKLSPVLGDEVQMYHLRKFYEDGGAWGVTRTARAKNQGTFLAAVDESESMTEKIGDEQSPSRATFSKALVLGLMNAAVQSGQEFYAVGFSSFGQISDLVTNRSPVSERMKFGLHHFNGGTNFNRPLSILLDVFDGLSEKDKEASDILFITDGECQVDTDVIDRLYLAKEQYGARLILLVIGNDAAFGEPGAAENIETHADIVRAFKSIEETATTIAEALWDSR